MDRLGGGSLMTGWIDWVVEQLEGADRNAVAVAFFSVWGLALLVWIILDWLGNPNRGSFRPQGPRRGRGIGGRWRAFLRAREDENVGVRETLRTAYGRSSLRLRWSPLDETTTTAYDEAYLPEIPRLLDTDTVVVKRPPVLTDEFAAVYDLDPIDLRDHGRHSRSNGNSNGTEPRRWSIGLDPELALNGRPPTALMVQSRTWKNIAAAGIGAVGEHNLDRARKGSPPRRWNPIEGTSETARLSGDNGTRAVRWSHVGIDPFTTLRTIADD